MPYLLDTNALSQLANNPSGAAAQHMRRGAIEDVVTSVIVACEIEYGLAKKQSVKLTRQMRAILDAIPILAFKAPAHVFYGRLRSELSDTGKTLSPNDMLIAAHALSLDATLVTDDRAFEGVPSLRVENWMR
ncbi:MAG: type II toxin-antitoxin system VapC family toxin [Phyllobacteriaceae bacterium]|nr:type II toxin-antitoxin system VapC family toxin [Phyllobacteriaceae bacterium]